MIQEQPTQSDPNPAGGPTPASPADSPPAAPKNPLEDRNCVTCGLSLRDRTVTETCPVCNTPVAEALAHNVIRDSDRRWLMSITWGARVLLMAMTLTLLFYFGELHSDEFSAGRFVIEAILTVGSMTAGAWMTLAPEPGAFRSRQEIGRKFARIVVVLAAIQLLADTGLLARSGGVPSHGLVLEFVLFQVLWIVGVYCHFNYLKWMLGRKQRNALRDMAELVRRAITVPWGVMLFVAILLLLPGSVLRGGIGGRLLAVFAAIVQFVMIAGSVLYGIFLFSVQYVFARAARESDEQFETRIA